MRTEIIRVWKPGGGWIAVSCNVLESSAGFATVQVPALGATWLLCSGGMLANLGGGPWRVLHEDDCAAICQEAVTEAELVLN